MAFVVKDRVREVTSSTGTGAIALGGAVLSAAKGNFRAFGSGGAGIANGDTLPYLIDDGANWEIGIGTYVSSGNQLQRTTVLSNSAGTTAAINLSGSAEVALVLTEHAWSLLAPLASPTLVGTPTAPTASPGTNTTQIATTAFVAAAEIALRPSSSGRPVGYSGYFFKETAGAVANNATTAGSNLRVMLSPGEGVLVSGSMVPSGTWRNVSGDAVDQGQAGVFVRES